MARRRFPLLFRSLWLSVTALLPLAAAAADTTITVQGNITAGSCSVSPVTVDLGDVAQAAFQGTGTVAGSKSFAFDINNCPAGLPAVMLTLHPTNGAIDAPHGIAQLSSDSTAQGVGVQLTWFTTDPLPLDVAIQLQEYTGSAISFTLNMIARYYQSAAVIRPGIANATFEVTLSYQ